MNLKKKKYLHVSQGAWDSVFSDVHFGIESPQPVKGTLERITWEIYSVNSKPNQTLAKGYMGLEYFRYSLD